MYFCHTLFKGEVCHLAAQNSKNTSFNHPSVFYCLDTQALTPLAEPALLCLVQLGRSNKQLSLDALLTTHSSLSRGSVEIMFFIDSCCIPEAQGNYCQQI